VPSFVVVGVFGAGKSSLAERFTNETFSPEPSTKPGVELAKRLYTFRAGVYESQDVDIWDSTGNGNVLSIDLPYLTLSHQSDFDRHVICIINTSKALLLLST